MTIIKVALLGVWHVHARDHIASLLARPERVEVVGVWDPDASAARAFAEEHGLKAIEELDDVLTRPELDGVVVNTATADHLEILSRAAAAGKHLFAEKVIAATDAEADTIVQAAAAADVTITIALQRLTESFVVTLQRCIAAGAVGTVTGVRTRFSHGGAFAEWLPEKFFDPAEAQGGVLIDLAAHSLYLGMLFAGGLPQRVSATLGFVTGRAAEDNVAVVMGYDSGVIVTAESSFVAAFSSYQVEVVGTAGTLAVDSADSVVRLRTSEDLGWVDQPASDRGPEPIDQFLDAIGGGVQDESRLALALALTSVVEAGYASASTGRAVSPVSPVE